MYLPCQMVLKFSAAGATGQLSVVGILRDAEGSVLYQSDPQPVHPGVEITLDNVAAVAQLQTSLLIGTPVPAGPNKGPSKPPGK